MYMIGVCAGFLIFFVHKVVMELGGTFPSFPIEDTSKMFRNVILLDSILGFLGLGREGGRLLRWEKWQCSTKI